MAYDEDLAGRLRIALKATRGITEKKMFGGISFLLYGNMVVGALGSELVSRFDPQKTEELLKRPGARPFDPLNKRPNKPMQGWLLVGQKVLKKSEDLKPWIQLGLEYARSLPKK
jgi:TfoX/Sxy family transcriptional regulator of competence genes